MQLTAHESCDTQRQSCDQINLGDSIKQITQSIEPKKKWGSDACDFRQDKSKAQSVKNEKIKSQNAYQVFHC